MPYRRRSRSLNAHARSAASPPEQDLKSIRKASRMVKIPFRRVLRLVPAALACAVLSIIALAVFGGAFGRGVAVGALGSLVLVGVFFISIRRMMARAASARLKPPTLPVKTWDYAMVADDLSGVAVSFRQFANRVILLNVWATWCAPCVAEMPTLFRLQKRLAGYDVEFAFLSSERPEIIEKFVRKHGWKGPFYQVTGDLPECFRSGAIPATFVVDRYGSIAFRHLGAARWDDERIVTFLQGLAAAPAT